MSNIKTLDEICSLLETYKGRDKILRTLCYVARLIGGLHKDELVAKKLLWFSSHLSGTRTTLRLLDDLPMIQYNLQYGLGSDEPDKIMGHLGVISNVIDQIYYPIEKMGFLAEHKLVTGLNSSKWDTASSICWALSIYLTLLRSLRYMMILRRLEKCITEQTNVTLEQLRNKQKYEMLTITRSCLDFVHAIQTLPPGVLWSSKLKTWHVGLIGTLSSVLGLYQIFFKRALK